MMSSGEENKRDNYGDSDNDIYNNDHHDDVMYSIEFI